MKNLLIAVVLLFSTVVFAADSTIALKGLTLKKGQVVTVELRSEEHFYVEMFRSPADTTEVDEIEIVLEDAISGTYDVRITVNDNNVGRAKKGEFAIGKLVSQKITKVTID